jgi:hypothetical protein
VRHAVFAAALVLAAYLSLVGVGLLMGSAAPMTPWPGNAPGDTETTGGREARTNARIPDTTPTGSAPATRPAATSSGAVSAPATAPRPRASDARPGNARGTPPANGRSKSPNPKKPSVAAT